MICAPETSYSKSTVQHTSPVPGRQRMLALIVCTLFNFLQHAVALQHVEFAIHLPDGYTTDYTVRGLYEQPECLTSTSICIGQKLRQTRGNRGFAGPFEEDSENVLRLWVHSTCTQQLHNLTLQVHPILSDAADRDQKQTVQVIYPMVDQLSLPDRTLASWRPDTSEQLQGSEHLTKEGQASRRLLQFAPAKPVNGQTPPPENFTSDTGLACCCSQPPYPVCCCGPGRYTCCVPRTPSTCSTGCKLMVICLSVAVMLSTIVSIVFCRWYQRRQNVITRAEEDMARQQASEDVLRELEAAVVKGAPPMSVTKPCTPALTSLGDSSSSNGSIPSESQSCSPKPATPLANMAPTTVQDSDAHNHSAASSMGSKPQHAGAVTANGPWSCEAGPAGSPGTLPVCTVSVVTLQEEPYIVPNPALENPNHDNPDHDNHQHDNPVPANTVSIEGRTASVPPSLYEACGNDDTNASSSTVSATGLAPGCPVESDQAAGAPDPVSVLLLPVCTSSADTAIKMPQQDASAARQHDGKLIGDGSALHSSQGSASAERCVTAPCKKATCRQHGSSSVQPAQYHPVRRSYSGHLGDNDDWCCPVCLEEPEEQHWRLFRCGHGVCYTCLQGMAKRLRDARKAACPICRAPVLPPAGSPVAPVDNEASAEVSQDPQALPPQGTSQDPAVEVAVEVHASQTPCNQLAVELCPVGGCPAGPAGQDATQPGPTAEQAVHQRL